MNIFSYVKSRLVVKLALLFLLIAIVPLLFAMATYYNYAQNEFARKIQSDLDLIADAKRDKIDFYTRTKLKQLELIAQLPELPRMIRELDATFKTFGGDSSQYNTLYKKTSPFFEHLIATMGHYDFFIINTEGDILYTVEQEDDLHTSLRTGPYRQSALARVFERAMTQNKTGISHFSHYPPSNKPAAFSAAAVTNAGRIVGTVAVQHSFDYLDGILHSYSGLGETGEVLTGTLQEGKTIFTSRLRHRDNELVIYHDGGREDVLTRAARGEKGCDEITDYRGKKVFASWRYIPSLRWGLVVKIDKDEAYAPLYKEQKKLIAIMLSALVLVIMATVFAIRTISRPILHMSHVARSFSKGNLKSRVQVTSDNELGVLGKEFNRMASNIEEHQKSLEIKIREQTGRLEKTNREMEKHLQIIDHNVIISRTDLHGIITYASEAFCRISGYSTYELIGRSHNIVRHQDMPDALYAHLWQTILSGRVWRGEIKNRKKDGDTYWIDMTITPNTDENGNIFGFTAIREDITDKKKIEELSITDALTGLYNRRHFDHIIQQEYNRCKRNAKNLVFIMIDVDHFKLYNDTYGHQMGDDVLRQVAKTLRGELTRADDFSFRIGGEEFGIVTSNMSEEETVALATKIRLDVHRLHIDHRHNTTGKYVTVSMGIAIQHPENEKGIETIIRNADDALYKAKEEGRNCIRLANA